jgi:hypothetical protein
MDGGLLPAWGQQSSIDLEQFARPVPAAAPPTA